MAGGGRRGGLGRGIWVGRQHMAGKHACITRCALLALRPAAQLPPPTHTHTHTHQRNQVIRVEPLEVCSSGACPAGGWWCSPHRQRSAARWPGSRLELLGRPCSADGGGQGWTPGERCRGHREGRDRSLHASVAGVMRRRRRVVCCQPANVNAPRSHPCPPRNPPVRHSSDAVHPPHDGRQECAEHALAVWVGVEGLRCDLAVLVSRRLREEGGRGA